MFKSLLIGILCVCAVALVVHAAWNLIASRALMRTLHTQAREGLPMNLRDIVPPPVPANENAMPLLKAAAQAMADEAGVAQYKPAIAELLEYRIPCTSAEASGKDPRALETPAKEALRQKLALPEVTVVFQFLDQAAHKPRCDFALDYSRGATILLPHLSQVRNAVRLLALRAYLRAEADPGAAMDDIRTALRIANFLRDEPFLVTHLVRVSCNATATAALGYILNETRPEAIPPRQAEALLAQLDAQADPRNRSLVNAFDGARIILGKQTFEAMLIGQTDPAVVRSLGDQVESPALWLGLYGSRFGRVVIRPLLKDDFRCYMDVMREYRSRAEQSYWDAAAQPSTMKRVSVTCTLTRNLVPVLDTCLLGAAQDRAAIYLARVGLMLALDCRAKSRYPASLADVPGGAPKDPFSGKDFVYHPTSAGYVLYSVGPDLKDNAGQGSFADPRSPDIVWRIGK